MKTLTNQNIQQTKSDKIFHIVNYCLMIALSITCLALAIYYKAIGDPNNRFLASIAVAVMFLVPVLIEVIFRCRISNFVLIVFISFSILAGLLGCVFNFYNISTFKLNEWYDVFIHILMGYMFCLLGLIVISRMEKDKKLNLWTIILFCVFLSLAAELVWELLEWFADSCLNQHAQGLPADGHKLPLVFDTNLDLLCNFSGSIAFLIHFVIGKFTKLKLGVPYMEKELCCKKVIVSIRKKKKALEPSQQEIIDQNLEEAKDNDSFIERDSQNDNKNIVESQEENNINNDKE